MQTAPSFVDIYMSLIVRQPTDYGTASKIVWIDYKGEKGSALIVRFTNRKGFDVMPIKWEKADMLESEIEEEQVNLYLTGYFNSKGVEW